MKDMQLKGDKREIEYITVTDKEGRARFRAGESARDAALRCQERYALLQQTCCRQASRQRYNTLL